MSQDEGIKRIVIAAISTIITTGIIGAIALIINIRVSNAIAKDDIVHIKEDMKQFAKESNVNSKYSILSYDIQENHADIKKFNNKVDEIKTLIIGLHAK